MSAEDENSSSRIVWLPGPTFRSTYGEVSIGRCSNEWFAKMQNDLVVDESPSRVAPTQGIVLSTFAKADAVTKISNVPPEVKNGCDVSGSGPAPLLPQP